MSPMNREEEFQEERPDLVKKRARSILFWQMLIALGVIYVLVTTSIVTFLAVNGYHSRQVQNQTLAQVQSCTIPGGECQQRGARAQAEAIKFLIENGEKRSELTRKIVIAAAACADQPGIDTVQQIQACVDEELKK